MIMNVSTLQSCHFVVDSFIHIKVLALVVEPAMVYKKVPFCEECTISSAFLKSPDSRVRFLINLLSVTVDLPHFVESASLKSND